MRFNSIWSLFIKKRYQIPRKSGLWKFVGSQFAILLLLFSLTLADFANGGIFLGPKISHFRELTVLVKMLFSRNLFQFQKDVRVKFPQFHTTLHCVSHRKYFVKSLIFTSQGAGRVFDPPKKFTIDETPIFWSGMTWGTMFTKVISPGQVEAQ